LPSLLILTLKEPKIFCSKVFPQNSFNLKKEVKGNLMFSLSKNGPPCWENNAKVCPHSLCAKIKERGLSLKKIWNPIFPFLKKIGG